MNTGLMTRPIDLPEAHRPVLPSARARAARVNVGGGERLLSLLGGAALAIQGLRRADLRGLGYGVLGGMLAYRGYSGHCSCYDALGISAAQSVGAAASVKAGSGLKVDESFTIMRPPDFLYRAWRDLTAFPHFMSHIKCITITEPGRSHWVARGPLGLNLEWDAEVYVDKPSEMIAWRSLAGSQVDTAGSVHFTPAPGGRGTEMRVILKYDPPVGKAAAQLARFFGVGAEQRIRADLRAFKQIMEAGEVPTTEGQTSCRHH
jgi:uncharacterized membrane protein